MKNKITLYTIIAAILFLINLVFAYKTIHEFVKVRIFKDYLFYPFDCDCDVPYFFDNHILYSNIMLAQGIIFSIFSSLSIYALIKKKNKLISILIILTILIFALVFINRQIH